MIWGEGMYAHMGLYFPVEVVHASHLLCGVLVGVAHVGVGGKAVLFELN